MPIGQPIDKHTGVTFIVAVVLALWLALVFLLGARGVYVRPPGLLPLPILIGFMAPIIVFLFAFWVSRSFRDFVLAVDIRLTTGTQTYTLARLVSLPRSPPR